MTGLYIDLKKIIAIKFQGSTVILAMIFSYRNIRMSALYRHTVNVCSEPATLTLDKILNWMEECL